MTCNHPRIQLHHHLAQRLAIQIGRAAQRQQMRIRQQLSSGRRFGIADSHQTNEDFAWRPGFDLGIRRAIVHQRAGDLRILSFTLQGISSNGLIKIVQRPRGVRAQALHGTLATFLQTAIREVALLQPRPRARDSQDENSRCAGGEQDFWRDAHGVGY